MLKKVISVESECFIFFILKAAFCLFSFEWSEFNVSLEGK